MNKLRLVFLALLCCLTSQGFAANELLLSVDEIKRTLTHGPWPVQSKAVDSGNELSQNEKAIAYGRKLFFDKRLSSNLSVSCATCHVPAKLFTDRLPVSKSLQPGQLLSRNSPSLFNAASERWYGWDGAADSLWSQALRPLFDEREMGLSPTKLQAVVARERDISNGYKTVFFGANLDSAETVSINIAKAIGAYVATLQSGQTAFDVFRNHLAAGNKAKAAIYPIQAQRGLQIFVGKGQCNVCHVGPMFSNGEFADIGIPYFVRPGVVDEGRFGGINKLIESPYNLLGRFSAADLDTRRKTEYVDRQHRNFGEFKVPSLRNVAQTAPYMHNGSLASLQAVVNHYSELNTERLHADGEQILKPLRLSKQEKSDLIAFLKTLSVQTRDVQGR